MADHPRDNSKIVVLGKASYRNTEIPHLETVGKAIAIRGKTLVTTKGTGAATIIDAAYQAAGGKTEYLTHGDMTPFTLHPVLIFSDQRMLDQLDEKLPEWRTMGWEIIHNPKATETTARYLDQILRNLGTPLSDGGNHGR